MKLILPLSVNLPRKKSADKVFILNLNIYRNTHHMILNQAKVAWKEIVEDAVRIALNSAPCNEYLRPPLRFIYTVYAVNNRAFDIGNVLPVIQKFTDDALIELKIIPDDNYKVIAENVHVYGGVDKDNPRVELEIMEYVK